MALTTTCLCVCVQLVIFEPAGSVRYVQESTFTLDKKFTTSALYLVPFETTNLGDAPPVFNDDNPCESVPGKRPIDGGSGEGAVLYYSTVIPVGGSPDRQEVAILSGRDPLAGDF